MSLDRRNLADAANGLRPHTLLKEDKEAIHSANYPAPPDMRAPSGWALSINGIPVRDAPTPTSRHWRDAMLHHYWSALTTEERNDLRWEPRPANYGRYEAELRRLHHEEMTIWHGEGPPPPPRDKNSAGWWAFWSVPGRTMEYDIGCIANGTPLYTPSASFVAPGASSFQPLGAEVDGVVVVQLGFLLLPRHVGAHHPEAGGEGGAAHPGEARRAERGRDRHPRRPQR